jgi:hypothetical protein
MPKLIEDIQYIHKKLLWLISKKRKFDYQDACLSYHIMNYFQ